MHDRRRRELEATDGCAIGEELSDQTCPDELFLGERVRLGIPRSASGSGEHIEVAELNENGAMPPRVFVSYAHEGDSHQQLVLQLVATLRGSGIDAIVDLHAVSPEFGWAHWTRAQMDEADYVIAVCTRAYRTRAEGRSPYGEGRGVGYEGRIIDQDLYRSHGRNTKYVPLIVADLSPEEAVPTFLAGYTHYRWPSDVLALLRHLTGQPVHALPPLGRVPLLPSRPAPAPLALLPLADGP